MRELTPPFVCCGSRQSPLVPHYLRFLGHENGRTIPGCSTWKSSPYILPGQHSRAGPSGRDGGAKKEESERKGELAQPFSAMR